MTIDERLDRLVGRHEALSQSVELLTKDVREMGQRMDEMGQRNAVLFNQLGQHVGSLTKYVGEIAEGTARLLHVAEMHEHRITRLEGGS